MFALCLSLSLYTLSSPDDQRKMRLLQSLFLATKVLYFHKNVTLVEAVAAGFLGKIGLNEHTHLCMCVPVI